MNRALWFFSNPVLLAISRRFAGGLACKTLTLCWMLSQKVGKEKANRLSPVYQLKTDEGLRRVGHEARATLSVHHSSCAVPVYSVTYQATLRVLGPAAPDGRLSR
jgi:hypothetical protein